MKGFIILSVLIAISMAHHTPEHRSIDEEPSEEQGTTEGPTGEMEQPKHQEISRHHTPQESTTTQGIPVLIPYPALRTTPVYYHQPVQYIPIYQDYPAARQGIGGGLQANLGPFSGGVGAGAETGGLGGGFNLDFGSFGGLNANAGLTPGTILTNNPGYNRYYNKYYTPTKYYTTNSKPTRYVTAQPTSTPVEYPVHQLASSSPALTPRAQPQPVLIPMYYY